MATQIVEKIQDTHPPECVGVCCSTPIFLEIYRKVFVSLGRDVDCSAVNSNSVNDVPFMLSVNGNSGCHTVTTWNAGHDLSFKQYLPEQVSLRSPSGDKFRRISQNRRQENCIFVATRLSFQKSDDVGFSFSLKHSMEFWIKPLFMRTKVQEKSAF